MAAPRRPLHAGAVVVAWTSGSVVLATGIGALLAFAWTVGGSPSQTVVHLDNAGMILSGVIGALGCVLAARARRRLSDRVSAWGWHLIAAGCLMLAAGQAAWAWLQLTEAAAVPFPSVSDIGFVGQCLSVALGTIVLVTGHRHREVRARLVIEGLVVAAAGQMLVWVLLLRDAGPTGDVLSTGLLVFYSFAGTLTCSFILMGLIDQGLRSMHTLLLLGLGSLVLAAVWAAYLTASLSADYYTGHPMDIGWVVALLMFGIAGVRVWSGTDVWSTDSRVGPATSNWMLVVLSLFMVGFWVLFGRQQRGDVVGDSLMAFLFLGLIARSALAARENVVLFRSLDAQVNERTQELVANDGQYRAVVDHIGEVVFAVDGQDRLTFLNNAWETVSGMPVEHGLGRRASEFVVQQDRGAWLVLCEALRTGQDTERRIVLRLRWGVGAPKSLEVWARARPEDDGTVSVTGTITDVTERLDAARRLERQARTDGLTGLANRTRVIEVLDRAQGGTAALLVLDLDRFKDLNDHHGHAAGDAALQVTAERLTEHAASRLGPAALVGRLGGDEFAIVAREPDVAAVAEFAAGLPAFLREQPVRAGGGLHTLSASVGWAVSPWDAQDTGGLLRSADLAMYEAKGSGVGAVRWTVELDQRRLDRLSLVEELREAIAEDQLVLCYQPIVEMTTGVVVSVEALVRWTHPLRGQLPPSEFVLVAEQSGLMPMLTDWVLRTALVASCAWSDQGVSVGTCVNLSAAEPFDGEVNEHARLWAAAPTAGPLELEITETAVMEDPVGASAALAALREHGASTVIDDFGTGYSSLGQLKRLPVSRLKIDRSLVVDSAVDERDAAMVGAIVTMSHRLGLQVVAEGVETTEVADLLERLGCDLGQGWLYGRPIPAGGVPALVRASTGRTRVGRSLSGV